MNQEHVTILNIHVPITSTLNFINLDLKTQINFNSVMVGGFIIPILHNGHIIWTKKHFYLKYYTRKGKSRKAK